MSRLDEANLPFSQAPAGFHLGQLRKTVSNRQLERAPALMLVQEELVLERKAANQGVQRANQGSPKAP
jgi:hypothetical protein